MFRQHVDDIRQAGEECFRCYQKKAPFTMSINFVTLMLCMLGKYGWGCTKFAHVFASKLYDKPFDDFTELDKINLLYYHGQYCSYLLEQLIVLFPVIDRFVFEQSLHMEGTLYTE